MKGRKIINLLRKFDFDQLYRLTKFISSPYFNRDARLIKLLDTLSQFHPDYSHPQFSAEMLYSTMFATDSFNKQKLTALFSKLYKLVELYLSIEYFLEQRDQRNSIYSLGQLNFYRTNDLPTLHQSKIKKLGKTLVQKPIKNYQFLYQSYLLELEEAQFQNRYDQRKGDINLQPLTNAFDNYYYARRVMLTCFMLNRKMILNIDYQIECPKVLLDEITKKDLYKSIPILVWAQALKLLMQPESTNAYNQFKNTIRKHYRQFPISELKPLFSFLENCAKRIFLEKDHFNEELFKLYQFQIRTGIIYFNNMVHPHLFKNIINIGLQLRRFRWVKKFMNDNLRFLPKTQRKSVYQFNLAELAFYKEDWEQVLHIHHNTEYKDIYYLIGAKRTMAKTYYELGHLELLDNFISTFRVFIFRKKQKLSTSNLTSNQNFINVLHQLIYLAAGQSKKIEQVRKNIENSSPIAEKYWLLEKVESLPKE